MSFFDAVFWLLCAFATFLPIISAQILPSNANSTVPTERKFILVSSIGGMKQSLQLDPLTGPAGAAGDLQQLKDLDFVGPLVLIDRPNIEFQSGDIAFIKCDLDPDGGPQQAKDLVSAAVQKSPGAMILYSVNYTSCRTQNFIFKYLYTTTDPGESAILEQVLLSTRATGNRAMITLKNRGESSGGDGNGFMKSPTTAVAMIILYSITGIITALFLVIIVVGAIRAHRHPERYWPRNEPGRPRPSRAKGIARAMLETIPIVKFGDREDEKSRARSRDVELENGTQSVPDPVPATSDVGGSKSNGQSDAITADVGPELVTTETAEGAGQSAKPENNTELRTENGLACSVCTDDFVKGQDIRVLPCNHKFHPECIDPWLLNVSGTCPLCRVDLRPVSSHPEPVSDLAPQGDAHSQDIPTLAEPANPSSSETAHPNRRSRVGLSVYIQNTLNWRRMRDATPEERIAALRHLRTVNGALPLNLDARTTVPEGQRRRRLSARLSRAWGTSSRPVSAVPAAPLPETPETRTRSAEGTRPAEEQR